MFGGSSTKPLTKTQIDRECAAWLTTSVRSANMINDEGLNRLLCMTSGGNYQTPHERTIKKHEKSFEIALRGNIAKILVEQGLIKADFSGPIGGFPLGSIEYDASSTQIDGKTSISLNYNYIDMMSIASKLNLAVKTFELTPFNLYKNVSYFKLGLSTLYFYNKYIKNIFFKYIRRY
jgi:hypothetical protein